MIEYVTGDLLAADIPAIAHGCNCQGMMGSGIAKPVREKFGEEMFKEYRQRCMFNGFNIGDVMTWVGPNDQILFNLATQETGGPHAKLWAINYTVRDMLKICRKTALDRVGVPRIGAGIGGLKWEHVEGILIANAEMFPDTTLVVYTLP